MLNRDFKKCVASFNERGIEYLVVASSGARLNLGTSLTR
jgi:hypothetical protein